MKINIGLWGAGSIALTHLEALTAIGLNVSCVVDKTLDIASKFALENGIEYFSDDSNIFISKGVTHVHVCTPPALHYDMVKFLLLNNINVLCEKPLCFDSKEAEELCALAKEKNLNCAVNFNVRYYPSCQDMKNIIASDDFGRVLFLHGEYLQQFHILPTSYTWRYMPKLAGNMRAITEIGTHYFDLAEYLLGSKIVAVSAVLSNYNPNRKLDDSVMYNKDYDKGAELLVDSEDSAFINLKFANNVMANVVLSEVTHGKMNSLTIKISGEKSSLFFDSENSSVLQIANREKGLITKNNPFANNSFVHSFASLMKDFYFNASAPSFEQGKHINDICCSIAQSNEQNNSWVEICGKK